jgi:hypothetical protein
MGTEISNEVIGEQLGRIRKAFESIIPEVGEQESEPTFESEHFSLVKAHVWEALKFYTPPFCEKVLQTVIAELAEKKKEYELEVKRQDADNELLNVTSEWPTEKLEVLITTLRGFKHE